MGGAYISSEHVRGRWGDTETTSGKVQKRRLEWLGHIVRMLDHCMPKITVRLAGTTSSTLWSPKKMERCGGELRHEGGEDSDMRWHKKGRSGTEHTMGDSEEPGTAEEKEADEV